MVWYVQDATGHPPIVVTDIETAEQIEIQHWTNYNFTIDAEYEVVTLPGSTSPHGHYSATGQRNIPLEVFIAASSEQGDRGDVELDLRRRVDFIESCFYPDIIHTSFGSVAGEPHHVRLTAGRLFDEVGRLRGLSVSYLSYAEQGDPLVAQVSFNLEVVEHKNWSYREVRSGQRRRLAGAGPWDKIYSGGSNNVGD